MIDGKKVTTTDTGIAFKKVSKNAPKLSFVEWTKYLDEIAKNKSMEVAEVRGKLVGCGAPGLSGTTVRLIILLRMVIFGPVPIWLWTYLTIKIFLYLPSSIVDASPFCSPPRRAT